jgi:hypothetical protein
MNVWDFVNAINSSKKENLIKDEYVEKEYVPYVVNKSFSYHADSLMYANAMNLYHFLPNKLQNDYLLNSIRPAKRFAKWVKKFESTDLEAVKTYYGYSTKKAREALLILTPTQITTIKKFLEGGMRDDQD